MAYRQALSSRASVVARRCNPSYTYVLRDDDHKHQSSNESVLPQTNSSFLQSRSLGNGFNKSAGFGSFSCYGTQSQVFLPAGIPSIGSSFCRNMSTTIGESSENMSILSDVAGVLKDSTVEAVASQAPAAVNEVAVAAADSFFPVALLQHFIDIVHSTTGFNWWASIAVTTLLIRGATLPLLINQLKSTSKLAIMTPRLEEIKEEMQNKGMDPSSVAEGQAKMQSMFKEYGVTPFTPLKGVFIQGPVFISFFLGITNMAEKVPSFKVGGDFWFSDLTIPDSLYIFPVLTALTFLVTVECNAQEGMEGSPQAGLMKNVMRIFAVLSIPLTAGFPTAIFCYWIPSNLFSLAYGLVIQRPPVKKFLGVPEIPVPPPSANTKPQTFQDVFSAIKRLASASKEAASSASEQSKPADRRIQSTSVLSNRLKTLEKQVKGRKRNKKR